MAKARPPAVTAEEVREIFDYDPLTGVVRWKRRISRGIRPGTEAGCAGAGGRVSIGLKGQPHLRARVAWAWMTGEWPPVDMMVDHRDRDCGNDRWENLRLATAAQNGWNRLHGMQSRSGLQGVSWLKDIRRWRAAIYVNGKRHYLGAFKTKQEAAAVYAAKAAELHGEFARVS